MSRLYLRSHIVIVLAVICLLSLTLSTPGSAYMSVEKEKELGDKLAKELQHNLTMIDDPVVKSYVDEIGGRLQKVVRDYRFQYNFYVVKESEPNAFAIPAGHIFINSGLIRLAANEDELAGVIGHEMAHSSLRHIAKAIERGQRISLATLAAVIAGAFISRDAKSTAVLTASAPALAQSLQLKYTRENEIEADQRGVSYVLSAGYDPRGMLTFLKKMYRWRRLTSPDIPTYLSTHPGTDHRIAFLSDNFSNVSIAPDQRAAPAGDVKKVQIRLFVIEDGGSAGVARYAALAQKEPNDVDALYGLGISYLMSGRSREAVSTFETALRLAPQDALILREVGISYFKAKEIDQAMTALRTALNTLPSDTTVLYYLAQGSQQQGDWEQSVDFYRKVLELDPQRIDIYYDLGELYSQQDLLGPAHENFGLYFQKMGKREMALFHFRKALEYHKDETTRRKLAEQIRSYGQ